MSDNSRNSENKNSCGSRGNRGERGNRPTRRDGDREYSRGGRDGRPSGEHQKRSHANRGGRGKDDKVRHDRSNPYRQGFREERMSQKENEPAIPDDVHASELDPSVLQDLRVLSKDNADRVAKHMIMAATWMADDPQLALAHARAAKNRAGRVGVVRESAGIAAYHAGEWKEALSELRAARRMSGGPGLLAVMADAERGLGRPDKAIEIGRSPEAKKLDSASKVELAIVVAGARHDLGQHDSALATLQQLNPDMHGAGFEHTRLAYAYANALEQVGRTDEARRWFDHVVAVDDEEMTDAKKRLEQLT